MPEFGERSSVRLETCHKDLQKILTVAIEYGPDFTVLCGHRTKEAQEDAVRDGKSKAPWPKSKHNTYPSVAVDIAPYPIDWNDLDRFKFLAGYIMGVAHTLGIPIRWGGDWDRDYDQSDEKFRDLPHFELIDV